MISQPPSCQAYFSLEQPTSADAVLATFHFFLQPKSCLGRLFVMVLVHTQTDTRPVELSTNDYPVVEVATYITHKQKRQKDIHDLSGIRSRRSSNRAAADLRLRPRGHRNWRCDGVLISFIERYGVILKYATVFFKNEYSTLLWARKSIQLQWRNKG